MYDITPLMAYRTQFPEALAWLEERQRDAQARRERLTLAHIPLSIGIMGQIKVGKSSFLNQLLFNGQPLLPEACTPQTANLTRISYSPTPYFAAHFYTPEDWARLEDWARSEDEHDAQARAARELVRHAQQAHGSKLYELLAQGRHILRAEDIDSLQGRIEDYISAAGSMTPLVENTELGLPIKELIGIEIVDTPGLNDPVVSRTDKTRAYMAQCDVVFFLSPASRLLDRTDQELLQMQLPSKGVKRLHLVITQFDSAILDDGFHRSSLAECEDNLRRKLQHRARQNIEQLAAQREKQGAVEMAQLLRNISEPLFASTYAQAFATLPPSRWSKNQQHIHQQFQDLAEDAWQGVLPELNDWLRIAGFTALQQALEQAREDKEHILAQQRASIDRELHQQWTEALDNLRDQAMERVHILQTKNLADLEAHQAKLQQRLDNISKALGAYVQDNTGAARARAQQIVNTMSELANSAKKLDEHTGYETRTRSYKVSNFRWYNPFTWFSSPTIEYYTETRTYRYLAASDAVENARQFLQQTHREMLDIFEGMISPEALSRGLRRRLLEVLPSQGEDFDPKGLRAMVDTTINSIPWPRLELAAPDIQGHLGGFPAEVRSHDEMQRLRKALESLVENIQHHHAQQLNQSIKQVCDQLDEMARQLQQRLAQALSDELARLRQAIEHKGQELERLHDLLKTIEKLYPASPA